MSNIVVSVKDLGKKFHIGKLQSNSHDTLGQKLGEMILTPFRRAGQLAHGHATAAADLDEEFWAIQDVNFNIAQGELVGIIGRNGAGKSTLLKILSRITEPTTGSISIRGRVGSLLEVGTGFHPELTGRENIYLNGAILGMTKNDISLAFDEIVSFSEVEKFLDTPVKHYSSGMTLRLAFAVAAHLEPEVLIVDEVLAVGDARFQRKCINKMEDVGGQGRTVLFVSHNMAAVTRMCKRVILLEGGTLAADGSAQSIVSSYLSSGSGTSSVREFDAETAPKGDVAIMKAVRVRNQEGKITESTNISDSVGIEIEFDVFEEGRVLQPHVVLVNDEGVKLFTSVDVDSEWRNKARPKGRYTSTAWIPGNLLTEGMGIVSVAIWALEPSRKLECWYREAVAFQVIDSMDGTNSARGEWAGDFDGVMRPLLKWETEYNSGADVRSEKLA